jgi:hypothetical protein
MLLQTVMRKLQTCRWQPLSLSRRVHIPYEPFCHAWSSNISAVFVALLLILMCHSCKAFGLTHAKYIHPCVLSPLFLWPPVSSFLTFGYITASTYHSPLHLLAGHRNRNYYCWYASDCQAVLNPSQFYSRRPKQWQVEATRAPTLHWNVTEDGWRMYLQRMYTIRSTTIASPSLV